MTKLGIVGRLEDEDAVYMVKKEDNAKDLKKIKKIHQNLNHKSKDQMHMAYRNAGILDTQTRKNIDMVVDNCETCKRNSRSKSKPSVAIPKAGDFNEIVALDLKKVGEKYILWMVCTFTKFVKGVVIKDKKAETVMNAVHMEWCMNVGFPSRGFWCDNGGEFRNEKLEEFVS